MDANLRRAIRDLIEQGRPITGLLDDLENLGKLEKDLQDLFDQRQRIENRKNPRVHPRDQRGRVRVYRHGRMELPEVNSRIDRLSGRIGALRTRITDQLGGLADDQAHVINRVRSANTTWSKSAVDLVDARLGIPEYKVLHSHRVGNTTILELRTYRDGTYVTRTRVYLGGSTHTDYRIKVNPKKPTETQHAVNRLIPSEDRTTRGRVGRSMGKALGAMLLLMIVFGAKQALADMSRPGFSRRKITKLAHAVQRNATDEIAIWIQEWFQMTGNPAVAGLGVFVGADLWVWIADKIENMSPMERASLARKMRNIVYPPRPPERFQPSHSAGTSIQQPRPKPKPKSFPDLNGADIRRRIYNDQLQLERTKALIKEQLGYLIWYRALQKRGQTGLEDTIRELARYLTQLRQNRDNTQQRIETYEQALKDPHREPGAAVDLPEVQPVPVRTAADEEEEAWIRRQLKPLEDYRQSLLDRLEDTKPWEEYYRQAIHRALKRYNQAIEELKTEMETLEELHEELSAPDQPKPAESTAAIERGTESGAGRTEVQLDLMAAWSQLLGGYRHGVDVARIAQRHEIDLHQPPDQVLQEDPDTDIYVLLDGVLAACNETEDALLAQHGQPGAGFMLERFLESAGV